MRSCSSYAGVQSQEIDDPATTCSSLHRVESIGVQIRPGCVFFTVSVFVFAFCACSLQGRLGHTAFQGARNFCNLQVALTREFRQ